MRFRFVVSAALSLGLVQGALATIWNVSSVSQLRSVLSNPSLSPGDEIDIAYGVYQVSASDDPKHWFIKGGTVDQPIHIVGLPGPNGEKPIFDATGQPIDRGVFYLWDTTPNYVIENLEIRNSRGLDSYSDNAAAAYIMGDNVTFRYCYSHHNDNGWFATDTAHNTTLEYCETAYNGKLPKYASQSLTHNHYMHSQGLTIRGCYIHDSVEGQNFKFRGTNVSFEYNWVENAASYEWEIASGNLNGSSLIIGNVFIKKSNTNRIIGLSDGTTSGVQGSLTLINNTFISTRSGQAYLFTASPASTNVYAYNNVFAGVSTTLLSWSGTGTLVGANNWLQSGITSPAGFTGSLSGTNPGFVNQAGKDFHVLVSSPLRNAGLDAPQWLNPSTGLTENRFPSLEYKSLAGTSARPNNARLDIGAYEFLYVGDCNRDGVVNVGDLQILVSSWGLSQNDSAYDARADLNGDGAINVGDLQLLVANWGNS